MMEEGRAGSSAGLRVTKERFQVKQEVPKETYLTKTQVLCVLTVLKLLLIQRRVTG